MAPQAVRYKTVLASATCSTRDLGRQESDKSSDTTIRQFPDVIRYFLFVTQICRTNNAYFAVKESGCDLTRTRELPRLIEPETFCAQLPRYPNVLQYSFLKL